MLSSTWPVRLKCPIFLLICQIIPVPSYSLGFAFTHNCGELAPRSFLGHWSTFARWLCRGRKEPHKTFQSSIVVEATLMCVAGRECESSLVLGPLPHELPLPWEAQPVVPYGSWPDFFEVLRHVQVSSGACVALLVEVSSLLKAGFRCSALQRCPRHRGYLFLSRAAGQSTGRACRFCARVGAEIQHPYALTSDRVVRKRLRGYRLESCMRDTHLGGSRE